jgi:hypothetical protein
VVSCFLSALKVRFFPGLIVGMMIVTAIFHFMVMADILISTLLHRLDRIFVYR